MKALFAFSKQCYMEHTHQNPKAQNPLTKATSQFKSCLKLLNPISTLVLSPLQSLDSQTRNAGLRQARVLRGTRGCSSPVDLKPLVIQNTESAIGLGFRIPGLCKGFTVEFPHSMFQTLPVDRGPKTYRTGSEPCRSLNYFSFWLSESIKLRMPL